MRQPHACSADWCVRESLRQYPLDLAARLEWLYDAAHYSTNEADRHELYRRIRLLRRGV